jgi:diguanylate cyclase (GGDEF)-like protein
MSDRMQMLEATLNLIDEGVAILDDHSHIVFWNQAAAALTGYTPQEITCCKCPDTLYRVDAAHQCAVDGCGQPSTRQDHDHPLPCPTLVTMGHKLGHSVLGMLRSISLSDSLGAAAGTALLFYPVEEIDSLPHGECCQDAGIERSQAEMEDHLDAAHHQWTVNRVPLGLMWVIVDQAESLRKSHGAEACEAMLSTVEQTLLREMKSAEIIGRWGANEFLVLTHERSSKLLMERAQRLAGLTRTADFRWWGDRVQLTVSIGVSQAHEEVTLQSLLHRAQQAMQTSQYAGGNQVTEARGS